MTQWHSEIPKAQAGDLESFAQIVREFQNMAIGYAYSILKDFGLAEDVAQEAFLDAYRALGDLREPKAFPGWLRRIVFKHCNRITRRKQVQLLPLEQIDQMPATTPNPRESAEKSELHDRVLAAVLALPETERLSATPFYINGYSMAEVGEFLEVPVSTVKNRLHAARIKLRERMVDMVDETLKARAPEPDKMADRVKFLLETAERLSKGVPVAQVFRDLASESATEEVRHASRAIHGAIMNQKGIAETMASFPAVFPPMAIELVRSGEELAHLDQALAWAAQWLQTGKYEVPPYLFADALGLPGLIQTAIKAGAEQLIIDSTQPLKTQRPWGEVFHIRIAHVMPEGSIYETNPYFLLHWMDRFVFQLKKATILDAKQAGDALTGKIRSRIAPDGSEEMSFPIRFLPCREGMEVRIAVRQEN